jgi:hypothetical protein
MRRKPEKKAFFEKIIEKFDKVEKRMGSGVLWVPKKWVPFGPWSTHPISPQIWKKLPDALLYSSLLKTT